MTLAFSDILESDIALRISRRFPSFHRLYDGGSVVILYPAGRMARAAAPKLRSLGVRVVAFGDSNPARWGTFVDGLAVISPAQIEKEYREASILLATSMYDSEIIEMLTALGCRWIYPMPFLAHCLPDIFVSREYCSALESVAAPSNHDRINQAYGLLSDAESRRVFSSKIEYLVTLDKGILDKIRSRETIYFDMGIGQLSTRDVFVDGGAFNGDTLIQFLKESNGAFVGYYAFEPDPENFSRLQEVVALDPQRICAIQVGLADHSGVVRFLRTSYADAKIVNDDDPGGVSLSVVSLDEFFTDRQEPTFVKMDIEGSEASALRGAAQVLARHQPRLAVSCYHYPTDLWEIPLLIHELNPGYRLMMRHYSREIDDTVCYAVPPERP